MRKIDVIKTAARHMEIRLFIHTTVTQHETICIHIYIRKAN